MNQLHEIKDCFPKNEGILENKPFGLKSCKDIPNELTNNYPNLDNKKFDFYKDTIIPWAKKKHEDIYYIDKKGIIKCDKYKEAIKYIDEPETKLKLRCRAIPKYQPNKQTDCKNLLMNECDNNKHCETY